MFNKGVSGDKFFISFAALLGVLTVFFLGQLELVRLSYIQLNDYRHDLLAHTANVTRDGRETLSVIDGSKAEMCSDENLTQIRLLAFNARFLRDVGRVKDNKIICTALWGRLSPPVNLPPSDHELDSGHHVWSKVPDIGKHSTRVDIVGKASAIVFISPVAFAHHDRVDSKLSAHITSNDGSYIYHSFGDTSNLGTEKPRKLAWYDLRSRRIVSSCVDELDICLIARLSDVSMLQQPPPILLALGAFGAFAGGGLGFVLVRWRRDHASLPQQIRRAILLERFGVVYQPLVRLNNEKIVGAEVLARLFDDRNNPVSPDVFIPIAEDLRIVGDITRLVMVRALSEMAPRLKENEDFYLSINVSVEDVLDTELLSFLNAEVNRHGLSSRQIILEVTERSTARHESLIEGMKRFRASGYTFFIDDFGTGYSNLAYLAKLPISGIKIDKMFTQAIGTEAVSAEIVENICHIARRLELKLVVEGVETREQADYVLRLHPNAVGQGWLFGKPVAVSEFGSVEMTQDENNLVS